MTVQRRLLALAIGFAMFVALLFGEPVASAIPAAPATIDQRLRTSIGNAYRAQGKHWQLVNAFEPDVAGPANVWLAHKHFYRDQAWNLAETYGAHPLGIRFEGEDGERFRYFYSPIYAGTDLGQRMGLSSQGTEHTALVLWRLQEGHDVGNVVKVYRFADQGFQWLPHMDSLGAAMQTHLAL
ncbi:hypothetical protein EX895_005100 [Sporisorium graminicola]|uniref:SnoaL-like domain-containing protein n=1 Tax=Sporisorium graminicola TaxID=280036 RepID=A0A4U7KP63_9BASI|nr:hypothetical protein EX895_005100 [Sporisorium graminicola]TKY86275.1 hypothetical protein EX895_005100 [Sporisorium graminicola]